MELSGICQNCMSQFHATEACPAVGDGDPAPVRAPEGAPAAAGAGSVRRETYPTIGQINKPLRLSRVLSNIGHERARLEAELELLGDGQRPESRRQRQAILSALTRLTRKELQIRQIALNF
jgi:hypothetical protein